MVTRYTIRREWGDGVFRPYVVTIKRERMVRLLRIFVAEGIPVEVATATPRFTIRRTSDLKVRSPWLIADSEHPSWFGGSPTYERALARIESILRREAGLPPKVSMTTTEILAEMEKRS